LSTHRSDELTKYQNEFSSVDYIHDYGLDPEKREIYLFGREEYAWRNEELAEPGIEYTIANQFIKNLRVLQSLGDAPILIHMKTCGGDWVEGMAIYQAILTCPVFCTILNYTHARSMSSIIFLAADYRVMMPYSTYMVHRGTTGFEGTVTQLETEFKQNQIAERQMFDIYIEQMKASPKFANWSDKRIENWLRKKMKDEEEVYFSAEEAVELGFAHSVFGEGGVYDWNALRDSQ